MPPRHQFARRGAGRGRRHGRAPGAALLAIALGIVMAAAPVRAQRSGDGFLFREPPGSLTLRGGFAIPRAGSDIFSFTTRELTLGRGDFDGLALGLDLALRVAPRADVVLSVGYSGMTARSEFRDWVDQDNLPIEQTTAFRRVPVTASLKAYVLPRGRSIGRFAWIPATWAPYVGAGAGAMWYSFSQRGDFVDPETRAVFPDAYTSSGWAPTAHALAGVDFSLTPRLALTGEGRYAWASAKMSRDFDGFQRIDLAGFSTTLGIQLRF